MERENHGNSNKVLLTVIGAATLITAMVGATFAYFTATDTSDAQTVSTATSGITVTVEPKTIENLSPTTFTESTPAAVAGKVVEIPVVVQGKSTANGQYTLYLNEPTITGIGDKAATNDGAVAEDENGVVTDFKWVVYSNDDMTKPVKSGSFSGTEKQTPVTTVTYTAGDGSTNNIDDAYTAYVYIENQNYSQNNLQAVKFPVAFTVSATTVTE